MENRFQKTETNEQEKKDHVCVGYLVPSVKFNGELEFKRVIESQQPHLDVFYDLKEEFNLEERPDIIVAETQGLEGYHMLEPLYKNITTNSMIYIDTLNATTHDISEIVTCAPAFDVAMKQIGYQTSYKKDAIEVMLDKIDSKEKEIAKRK